MKFLVKKNKNEICGLCKKPANRGVVTFLDAYENDIEQEACSEVANQVKGWRKNTQAVIAENEAFFGNLADVTDVYVLGHSMAEVDLPYFERVRDVVNEGSYGISLFMVSMTDKGRNR